MINYAHRLPPGAPVELINDTTVRKIAIWNMEASYLFMERLIKHLIKYPDPLIVPISNYRLIRNHKYDYRYSYDMERLGIISKIERRLVDDCGHYQDYLGRGFWNKSDDEFKDRFKDYPRLAEFIQKVSEQGRYWDLHGGNVMIDLNEDYKLIDVEGFLNLPMSLPENNWITNV